jgi:uracil DNA glycosylase
MEINTKIDSSWLKVLEEEFNRDYFKNIKEKIAQDIKD